MIIIKRIRIERCIAGVYLRWWFNGWHYYCFTNQHEVQMRTTAMDIMVTQVFSVISKIERPTKLKAEYGYTITVENITAAQLAGFTGLLMAEQVQQYDTDTWYDVEITRGVTPLMEAGQPAYDTQFEVTRKELPDTAAVYQKSQYLYVGDTLADLDDDEIIPQNKQVNDIAEMQDRQSDFTATFKVRKSRAMRALFELSGEVGASTNLPYEQLTCKLVQDGIEIITAGNVVFNKVDDQYYHISVYSGNLNFFKAIEGKKLGDLTLASTNHTWTADIQATSNASDLDYVYPLCEPSDDGGITPLAPATGSRVEVYGGFIWPFVKVKAIWDEIMTAAGFTASGDILTDGRFTALYIPIVSLTIPKGLSDKYLYSVYWGGSRGAALNDILGAEDFAGAVLINGDENFRQGYYYLPYAATYKIRVSVISGTLFDPAPVLSVYKNGSFQGNMTVVGLAGIFMPLYEYEVTGTAGQHVEVLTAAALYYYYSVTIAEIKDAAISYGSVVEPRLYLPDMTQTDFIKMVCNMFGLIPEAQPRSRTIKFWNYAVLYTNIPQARNWSAYLSERDDEVEFKFGDYAQENYLRYRDSEDVKLDAGTGVMRINDTTLPLKKDVVQLPVSTCDEVYALTDVAISRIALNKYDEKTDTYAAADNIDPRVVLVSKAANTKTFGIRTLAVGGTSYDTVEPKKASSSEVAFSALLPNYGALTNMLTRTNLRRAKFNLPAYEVAGFRHEIPIYLSQYKAYFYVNKITNYVVGKLCTIELIKL